MEIEFSSSARSTVGLEWEIVCVDRATGELAPAAPPVIREMERRRSGDFPMVTTELLTNTLELVSSPHARVRDAVGDLARLVDEVRAMTEPQGIDLMCSGTHPISLWRDQEVTPGKRRYAKLIDRTQWWGRQLLIWGVHMHVGVDERDKALPIVNALLPYFPHFQAISASSPFWAGEATGYASNRALMFQQLPTAGLPPQLGAWANYEQIVDDLVGIGVIEDHTELRWDVRPSPRWGTVEVRFCDGVPTLTEVAALGALAQCLVEELSTALDDGADLPALQPWFIRENKWRSARYGMDAVIIIDTHGTQSPVREELRAMVARLEPIAERLGCLEELQGVSTIMELGASYQRQLAIADMNGGDLKSVIASLVGEMKTGLR